MVGDIKKLRIILAYFVILVFSLFGFSDLVNNAEAARKSTSARVDAVYVGKIDSNSIEVLIKNKPTTIMLLEKNKHLIKGFKKGDKVRMTYWVNVKGQKILGSEFEKITPSKPAPKPSPTPTKTALIVFTGLIDNKSFEAVFGEKDQVVLINEKTQKLVKGLKNGDVVRITYTVNKHGQMELVSLKKE